MSKNKKKVKRGKNKRNTNNDSCDVTIEDFANASRSHQRPKKNFVQKTNLVTQVKELNSRDDRAWDEKVCTLYENESSSVCSYRGNTRKAGNDLPKQLLENVESGVDYPIDIYFLISEHITPECVGVFAALCKTSYAVVSSAKFWFSLYKRYCTVRTQQFMPEVLRLQYVNRLYGLRAQVIRALYCSYYSTVTLSRVIRLALGKRNLDVLKGHVCQLAYSKHFKDNQWVFYFKMKKELKESNQRQPLTPLDILEDIHANPDEGCKFLQVITTNYILLPMLNGLILHNVSRTLDRDMINEKLQLDFRNGPIAYQTTSVVLNEIWKIHLFDWWHPMFPASMPNRDILGRAGPVCETDF